MACTPGRGCASARGGVTLDPAIDRLPALAPHGYVCGCHDHRHDLVRTLRTRAGRAAARWRRKTEVRLEGERDAGRMPVVHDGRLATDTRLHVSSWSAVHACSADVRTRTALDLLNQGLPAHRPNSNVQRAGRCGRHRAPSRGGHAMSVVTRSVVSALAASCFAWLPAQAAVYDESSRATCPSSRPGARHRPWSLDFGQNNFVRGTAVFSVGNGPFDVDWIRLRAGRPSFERHVVRSSAHRRDGRCHRAQLGFRNAISVARPIRKDAKCANCPRNWSRTANPCRFVPRFLPTRSPSCSCASLHFVRRDQLRFVRRDELAAGLAPRKSASMLGAQ